MKKNDNNFKRAMNELLNMDISGSRSVETDEKAEAYTERNVVKAGEDSGDTGQSAAAEVSALTEAHELPAGGQPAFERPSWETVITQDVIIDGNIISGSNLKILGQVHGNINCGGTVILAGNVEGDVCANALKFQSGNIHGNVSIREEMTADKATQIKGDIKAGRMSFSGYAEGDFEVQDSLELRETAAVIGNIRANGIAMYNGSKVKGMLDIGGDLEELNRDREE